MNTKRKMKRTQVGDVYAFKTERGYRIIQWGYFIEKQGNFVRVFPDFYAEIPPNIEAIVSNECSYIIQFAISKFYRKGMLEFLYRAPLDSIPPFPQYYINYRSYGSEGSFEVCEFVRPQNFESFDGYPDGRGLPEKYQNLKLINGCVDAIWFIYLLTSNFDLHHWDLFYPGKIVYDAFLKKYEARVLK